MNNSNFLRTAIKMRGSIAIETIGNSMSPSLISGDKTRLVPKMSICIGRLVAFPGKRSGQPVLHRIVKVEHNSFTAVGDGGNNSTLERVDNIIGFVDSLWNPQKNKWVCVPVDDRSIDIAYISRQIAILGDNTPKTQVNAAALESLLRERRNACRKWRETLLENCVS